MVLGGGMLLGCGSDVVIEDEDPGFGGADAARGRQRSTGSSGNGDTGSSGQSPPCIRCGDGDCGWCAHEGGDVAYRCALDVSPRSDMTCDATGNLFVDPGSGAHYVCYRCFD